MGIEANTGPADRTIEKLNQSWPLGTDTRSFWDDHARLIKAVLKNIFPGAGGNGFNTPIIATEAELNQLSGVLLSSKLVTPKVDTSQGVDIASSATVNLDAATGQYVTITGTTAITGITLGQGHVRVVLFSGSLTLTNGINLVLPGGADITTASGDIAVFVGSGGGGTTVRCISYTRANGKALSETDQSPLRKIGTFTKNLADADLATNTITGIGFLPKLIRFSATDSHGAYDSVNNYCVISAAEYIARCIAIKGSTTEQSAAVTAMSSGQFTLTWHKTGSPIGSASIFWEAVG